MRLPAKLQPNSVRVVVDSRVLEVAASINTELPESELRTNVMELRGCGATVQQIAKAMRITQQRVKELTL